eukprot:1150478-Pelagomonas_calceolata.AAC.14
MIAHPYINETSFEILRSDLLLANTETSLEIMRSTQLLANTTAVHIHHGCVDVTQEQCSAGAVQIRSGRIYGVDTASDPKAPRLVKTVEPEQMAALNLGNPHTSHCLPSREIMVSALEEQLMQFTSVAAGTAQTPFPQLDLHLETRQPASP